MPSVFCRSAVLRFYDLRCIEFNNGAVYYDVIILLSYGYSSFTFVFGVVHPPDCFMGS